MKNPCWKGYEAYGMKKKNGKEVPNCVPVKEDVLQDIKAVTKTNIVSSILEAKGPILKAKLADGPGKKSQRPKSWNKGTKAGSEKRKSREEGKREASGLYEEEEKPFDPSTLDMFDGRVIPPDSWYNNVPGFGKGTPPSKYYKHLLSQGMPHEEALRGTKNMFGMNPPVKWPKPSQRQTDLEREGGQWMRGPNGERTYIRGPDVHDARNDGYFEESAQHEVQEESIYSILKSRMNENKDWVPDETKTQPSDFPDRDTFELQSTPTGKVDRLGRLHHETVSMVTDTLRENPGSHGEHLARFGGIERAIAHGEMSGSDDPTVQQILTILRGTQHGIKKYKEDRRADQDVPF